MKCFHTFEKLDDKVRTIASNNHKIYFGCKSLYEIDLKTQKETKLESKEDFGSIYALKYFQDQNLLFIGYHNGNIQIVQNMKVINTFKAHKQEVKCFSFLDDKTFLSGSYDKTLKSWDLKTMKEISSYDHLNPINDILTVNQKIYFGSENGITCFKDSNLSKMDYQKNDHKGEILSLCSFENFIFTASKDSTWKVFDIEIKSSISTCAGHSSSISRIARDEVYVYTCSGDKTVRKWNLFGFYEEDCLNGHTEPIRSLDVVKTKYRTVIASGGQDNCVKLWK
jgi:WD40 repeat protein